MSTLEITTGKIYITRDGHKVRIICDDRKSSGDHPYPIIGLTVCEDDVEHIVSFTKTGNLYSNMRSDGDLVQEYNSAMDIAVDQPIWVRDNVQCDWIPRHFCKYENDRVYTWIDGYTSHTTDDWVSWKYFSKENPK